MIAMRTARHAITLVIATTWCVVLSAEPSPLRFGTWTLNIAKSTFDPGPPPMSQMRKEEKVGRAIKTVVEGVDAKGNKIAYAFTVTPDGKDYPIAGPGVPYASDTVAFVDIDPFTIDATFKKAGKVTGTAHSVMSKDGRTLTVTSKGTNAAGQRTNNVTIWDKQ
jgi:hypothetical protein